MDKGHAFVKRIETPESRRKAGNVKGPRYG
jgi:hypothetical protein